LALRVTIKSRFVQGHPSLMSPTTLHSSSSPLPRHCPHAPHYAAIHRCVVLALTVDAVLPAPTLAATAGVGSGTSAAEAYEGSRRFRVPHILSDSNVASLVQSSFRKQSVVGTPSSSSVWDWENFYPSLPSDSKFFKRRKADMEDANRLHELEEEEKVRAYLHHPHPTTS
jgi:hypothetical protein